MNMACIWLKYFMVVNMRIEAERNLVYIFNPILDYNENILKM
jgi:hypothetical protein